jgi:hypothetical protein
MFWSLSQSLDSTPYFEEFATWFEFDLNFLWHLHYGHWRAPKLFNGLKCESKLKTLEE